MDKTVAGAAAGIASGIIVGLLSMALSILNICNICLISIGASMFTTTFVTPGFTAAYFIGWASHLAVSMILGVILTYFLFYTGKDYGLIKGAMFGWTVWFIGIALISPQAGFIHSTPDTTDIIIILGYHLLFGLLTAALLLRYAKFETVKQ
jgi:hypothetical protein